MLEKLPLETSEEKEVEKSLPILYYLATYSIGMWIAEMLVKAVTCF